MNPELHWTEIRFNELIQKGHSQHNCDLHYCYGGWDGLPICNHVIEYEYCGCEKTNNNLEEK